MRPKFFPRSDNTVGSTKQQLTVMTFVHIHKNFQPINLTRFDRTAFVIKMELKNSEQIYAMDIYARKKKQTGRNAHTSVAQYMSKALFWMAAKRCGINLNLNYQGKHEMMKMC